jgi:hypothetical protein
MRQLKIQQFRKVGYVPAFLSGDQIFVITEPNDA